MSDNNMNSTNFFKVSNGDDSKVKNRGKSSFKKEDNTLYKLKLLEIYIRTYYPDIKDSHFTTLIDIIFMAAVRNDIYVPELLEDLYKGILDLDAFRNSHSGNIYDFITPKYVSFAKRIKDINVGSNGGMASVGKGEWLVSIGSGIDPEKKIPRASIVKNGKGDLLFDNNKTEEVKWNGGKISTEIPGNEVSRKFNSIIKINDKEWVPFRSKDKDKYSGKEKQQYNAVYWNAISKEDYSELSDNELKKKIINMAFKKIFEKCSTFIMFNDDGLFKRFNNTEEANIYYQDRFDRLFGHTIRFECRAKQINPIAMYCDVF